MLSTVTSPPPAEPAAEDQPEPGPPYFEGCQRRLPMLNSFSSWWPTSDPYSRTQLSPASVPSACADAQLTIPLGELGCVGSRFSAPGGSALRWSSYQRRPRRARSVGRLSIRVCRWIHLSPSCLTSITAIRLNLSSLDLERSRVVDQPPRACLPPDLVRSHAVPGPLIPPPSFAEPITALAACELMLCGEKRSGALRLQPVPWRGRQSSDSARSRAAVSPGAALDVEVCACTRAARADRAGLFFLDANRAQNTTIPPAARRAQRSGLRLNSKPK